MSEAFSRSIARVCDMGSGNKIELLRQDDGDMILQIMPEGDVLAEHSVEICASGSRSPNTWRALHDLFDAMELDESKRAKEPPNE